MIALLGIGQRRAVWDTYVLLFGGSIGSYIKLYKERLSETGSSLINYRLILITLPLLLSGAVLGVMMGKFLPKIIVGILLFLILLQVIIKTNRSYKNSFNKNFIIVAIFNPLWKNTSGCCEFNSNWIKSGLNVSF